ncbi:MAG: hypothetical protein ACK5N8_06810 [Alphaproteobacteria bacterium]
MKIIIKKGTNASAFKLSSGIMITLTPDLISPIKDEDFELLMEEYGDFITPRILSDKNPSGCFIINNKEANAQAQSSEIANETQDNSRQLTEEEANAQAQSSEKKSKKKG